jgi:hypothetical protein
MNQSAQKKIENKKSYQVLKRKYRKKIIDIAEKNKE